MRICLLSGGDIKQARLEGLNRHRWKFHKTARFAYSFKAARFAKLSILFGEFFPPPGC